MSDYGRRSPTVATPVAADIGETARTADADRDSTPAGRSSGARAADRRRKQLVGPKNAGNTRGDQHHE